MMQELLPTEVAQFRDMIEARLGLQFDDTKLGHLARVLAMRITSDGAAYLSRLAAEPASAPAWHRLAADLTVTETYFYRSAEQIQAYAELAAPACQQARSHGEPVRVLSVGCASGEEPYTLAIAAREAEGLGPHSVEIRAIDANPVMLAKAARARYTSWSLRELRPELLGRWFTRDGELHVLSDAVRRAVIFEQRNLALDDAELWAPGRYDIVFCRNLLMYFSPAQARAAVARIATGLAPGGYLFLGHAETLRGLSNDFHLCQSHGTFYYKRKPGGGEPALGLAPGPLPWRGAAVRPVQMDDPAWWGGVITRATQRIHSLAVTMPARQANRTAPAQPDLHQALLSLRQEQFAQSLAQIGQLPPEHADDPEVLLLKAVSLSQSGALVPAQQVCRQLLERDDLHAGAYYVLALCREGSGDFDAALKHYRSAAYLDPGFALARLHIGVLERRRGEAEAARRDLAQALLLLEHEDPARLLLFGGGFPRSALIGLCRAELAAFGAAA
ncbi:CheR family methyltransferase [Pseudoduganella sp. UC29_106]|uniref:CheR family methyltransferase n=1 Tax=Pseudoduganella sp. UC29_106 TaxID=3374553 RepID=UPI003756C975